MEKTLQILLFSSLLIFGDALTAETCDTDRLNNAMQDCMKDVEINDPDPNLTQCEHINITFKKILKCYEDSLKPPITSDPCYDTVKKEMDRWRKIFKDILKKNNCT
ncbi:Uncharacterised protein g2642 [Pycnogonum litorale]